MIVFRLSKSNYSYDLTGTGAEKAGGRWNNKGIPMVYTSESRSLCTVEILVHVDLRNIPEDLNIVTLEIPDDSILDLDKSKLPEDWKSHLHPDSTRQIGKKFVSEKRYLVMKVPSAIVEDEFNFLLNPNHKDIKNVKIVSVKTFKLDKRLFSKQH